MDFYDFERNEDYYLFMVNDWIPEFGPVLYPITKGQPIKEDKERSFLFIADDGTQRWFTEKEQRYVKAYKNKTKAYEEYQKALNAAKSKFNEIINRDDFGECEGRDQKYEKWCDYVYEHAMELKHESYKIDNEIIKIKTIKKDEYKKYLNIPLFGSMYWVDKDNKITKLNAVLGHLEKRADTIFFIEEETGEKYTSKNMYISEDKDILLDQYKHLAEKAIVEINRRIDVLNKLYFDVAEEINNI